MKKLFLLIFAFLFLSSCTYLHTSTGDEFMHIGTAACSYQTIDGQPLLIIAEDDVVSDVIKILIEKGLLNYVH